MHFANIKCDKNAPNRNETEKPTNMAYTIFNWPSVLPRITSFQNPISDV